MTYVYSHDNIVLSEMNRNHAGYNVFEEFFKRAFGAGTVVVINHHLVFKRELEGGKRDVQEVPSADTLLFSHHYMKMVFGEQADTIMRALLMCKPQEREAHLARELDLLRAEEMLRNRRAEVRQPLALRGGVVTVSTQPTDYQDEGEHHAGKV